MNNHSGRVSWILLALALLIMGLALLFLINNESSAAPDGDALTSTAQALTNIPATVPGTAPTVESPTATVPAPIGETPLILSPTPTSTPQFFVRYDVRWECHDGKPVYYIKFIPSGGMPDYTYSPAEPFYARPGSFMPAKVTSQDGQYWEGSVEIPGHDCRQRGTGGEPVVGATEPPVIANPPIVQPPEEEPPAEVIPECEPLGNSGKCRKDKD
jgi:hypothetical protein